MSRGSSIGRPAGTRAPRVAILSIDAVGHLNPMLAVASALASQTQSPCVRAYGSAGLASLFVAAGTEFETLALRPAAARPTWSSGGFEPSALAVKSFLNPQDGLAELVDSIARFRPDVVVHDVFDLRGAVVSRTLGVPAGTLLPFAGLRALGEGFAEEHGQPHPALFAANDRLIRDFGVDILGDDVCLPVLFPSRELSLVTAIEEQSPPSGSLRDDTLDVIERSLESALHWVGPCLGDVHWGGAASANFPIARAAERRASGALTVLFSLGTNIMTFRRGMPMGGATSGDEFVEAAVDLLLDALGEDDAYQLLVATGGWTPARSRGWPGNAVVGDVLPQRRLLAEATDVFITHHGYNSTVEATAHGVPMVAFPGYGDQVSNAEFAVRRGVSIARWDLRAPVTTCTAEDLRQAVDAAASPTGPPAKLPALRRELELAGGATAAADLILGLV